MQETRRETFLLSQRTQSLQNMEGWIDIRKQTKEQKINDKFVFKNVRWRKGQKDTTPLYLKFMTEKRTKGYNSILSEVPDEEKDKRTQLNCI